MIFQVNLKKSRALNSPVEWSVKAMIVNTAVYKAPMEPPYPSSYQTEQGFISLHFRSPQFSGLSSPALSYPGVLPP